jgi:hypothetical protein
MKSNLSLLSRFLPTVALACAAESGGSSDVGDDPADNGSEVTTPMGGAPADPGSGGAGMTAESTGGATS